MCDRVIRDSSTPARKGSGLLGLFLHFIGCSLCPFHFTLRLALRSFRFGADRVARHVFDCPENEVVANPVTANMVMMKWSVQVFMMRVSFRVGQ